MTLAARLQTAGVPAVVNFTQAGGAALATITGDKEMGAPEGIDIIVTYPTWPRAWQIEADWLRFADEGGYTREVISHFIFFSSRILGPLRLAWSVPGYPSDPDLCETHIAARLENAGGIPVSIFGSVGGAQAGSPGDDPSRAVPAAIACPSSTCSQCLKADRSSRYLLRLPIPVR